MKLGFSIESPALIDKTDTQEKEVLLAGHKNLKNFLTLLKKCGVQSIEIRKLDRCVDEKEYRDSIQLIWDLGMEISIHGSISGDTSYGDFLNLYPSLKYIIKHFKEYQSHLIMPIHAYQGEDLNESRREVLFSKTVEELKKWNKLIVNEGLPIYLALENNREKDNVVDPGNSTKNVERMVNEINGSHVGICWDMGHYYSNILKDRKQKTPPNNLLYNLPDDSFLQKVIHTHIHGLDQYGTTHFPVTSQDSLPLESYVLDLHNRNYEGVLNLELSLSRWDNESSSSDEISTTVGRLKRAML